MPCNEDCTRVRRVTPLVGRRGWHPRCVPYCTRCMYTEDGTHFAVFDVQSPLVWSVRDIALLFVSCLRAQKFDI
jgi:hypothetical protein